MKNSDMPEMPFTKVTQKTIYEGGEATKAVNAFEGLTKREMFAMHAMTAMISSSYVLDFNEGDPDKNNELTGRAIGYADALLKELEK